MKVYSTKETTQCERLMGQNKSKQTREKGGMSCGLANFNARGVSTYLEKASRAWSNTQPPPPVPNGTNTNMYEIDSKSHFLMCENTTHRLFLGSTSRKGLVSFTVLGISSPPM